MEVIEGKRVNPILNFLRNKYFLFALVSLIFAFLATTFGNGLSSFLYADYRVDIYTSDADFFYLGGSLLLKGQTPYIDFFDHKGLYIFYFHAFGQILGGRLGLYFLEIFWFSLVFYALFMIAEELSLGWKGGYFMSLFLLALFVIQFGGASDEEIMLPFVAIPLYFYVIAIHREEDKWFLIGNFAWGVSAGFCLNLRPSDAMFALSAVAFYAFYGLKKRKYLPCLVNAGVCLLGMGLMCLPALIHSLSGGFFSEMIDSVLLSNFSYVGNAAGSTSSRYLCMAALGAFALLMVPIMMFFRKKGMPFWEWSFYIFHFGIVILFQIIVARFPHYWIMAYPSLALLLCRLLCAIDFKRLKRVMFPLLCSLLMSATTGFAIFWPVSYYLSGQHIQEAEIKKTLRENISEGSRNGRTLGIDIENGMYLLGDITPGYPDFAMQSWHARFDDQLIPDLLEHIRSGNVDYVIINEKWDGNDFSLELRNFVLDDPENLFEKVAWECPVLDVYAVAV